MNSTIFKPALVSAAVALSFSVVSFLLTPYLLTGSASPEFVFASNAFISALTAAMVVAALNKQQTQETVLTTIYVGNLPYRANEATVRRLFADHGQVLSVRLMKDRETGKRRGFGFVEMPATDAELAIQKLNEVVFQERTLKVREANEKRQKDSDSE